MYTKDFSKAPGAAQGTHLFFGGTQYTGVRALIQLAFVWMRLSRRMRAAPGYRGHFLWYRFPFTFGNMSFWDSRKEMMAFAQSAEHRNAIRWLVKPGTAHASFIRFLVAQPEGHTIGQWRAEDDADAWRTPVFPFSSETVGD